MEFQQNLSEGILIKRYKRFLADVQLPGGEVITVHCPNSGSMKACQEPGWKVMISDSNNPKRKLRCTLEMVFNGRCWIGVNTMIPNKIAAEAIRAGKIPELSGYPNLKTEAKYGRNSRIDILLSEDDRLCYVEVKNVTLVEDDGFYKFPDAVTERGRKHLYELRDMVRQGHRAVMLYVIQRSDGSIFKPAEHIDPAFAESLREVHQQGVEILPYLAEVSPQKIEISHRLDFKLR